MRRGTLRKGTRVSTGSNFRKKLVIVLLVATVIAALVAAIVLNRPQSELGSFDLGDGVGSVDADERERGSGEAESDSSEEPLSENLIHGQVVRPNGEPAVGVRVVAQSPGQTEPYEATTNVGGMFQFAELPLALYAVEAAQEGYGPAIAIGVVPGGAPLRLVLQSGSQISGDVRTRDGRSPAATVHVGGPGMFPQRSQATNPDGSFNLSGLREGTYEAIATAPGLSSGFIAPIEVNSDTPPQPLRVELRDAPTMQLRVIDAATGEPIDAGVITLAERPFYVLSINALIADGQATVDFLPVGEYHLRARAPGYMPEEERFWVSPSGGEVTIALRRGATVQGRVVDEAGNGLSRARLRAVVETTAGGRYEMSRGLFETFHRMARPDGASFWWPTSDYSTDESGNFTLSGLPAGSAQIVAQRSEYATGISNELTLQANAVYEDVRIEMARGRALRGRVENAAGAPISGATVSVSSALLPSWVAGETIITDRSGLFRFENLPAAARIVARHPDYGMVSETLELPLSGRDDYIVRLEDETMYGLEGRVLTVNEGAASGARVWLMRGNSNVPVCQTVSGDDGQFSATHCSAQPDRILIFQEGFAPLIEELNGDHSARDWVLRRGGEIALVSQRFPVRARVEPLFNLPEGFWPRPSFALDRWTREILPTVAPGDYRIVCSTEGYTDVTTTVNVGADARVEAVCPMPERLIEVEIGVVDRQNVPVEGALVLVDGLEDPLRTVSDAQGRVRFEGPPGTWLRAEAIHERWGSGNIGLQIPWEREDVIPIRLTDPVGGPDTEGFLARLAAWGVDAVSDGRSIVIDRIVPDSPASGVGLRRRDLILWARPVSDTRLSVGIRRHNDLRTFELVQRSP